MDLLLRATPENLERRRRSLHFTYDDPNIEEIRDADLLGDYPAVRYYPPTGELFLDVMARPGDIADFDTVESEIKEVEGIRVRVATPRALYPGGRAGHRPPGRIRGGRPPHPRAFCRAERP